jgi:hypothetical protein
MAMMPYRSLRDFVDHIAEVDPYPFYAVLLYTPLNSLDEHLRSYVRTREHLLNSLTGRSCLLFVLEDLERGLFIEQFKPEEVYEVARYLGVAARDLPCIVFFSEPRTRNELIILRLREVLGQSDDLSEDDLTLFFRSLQSVVDECTGGSAEERLQCLRVGLEREWPKKAKGSTWAEKLATAKDFVLLSVTTGSTLLATLSTIVKTLATFGK